MIEVCRSHKQSGSLLCKTAAFVALLAVSAKDASAASRKVLVLSVSDDGRQLDGLRAEIGQLVQRAGGYTVDDALLPLAKRACEDPGCLRELAKKWEAELLVSARISKQQRFERLLDLWIYDSSSGHDLSSSDLCDARDLKDCVVHAAGRALGPLLNGPAAAASPIPSLLKPLPATPLGPDKIGRGNDRSQPSLGLPTWRTALGVSFALLTVGALTTAVWAQTKNGTYGTDPSGKTDEMGVYRTSPLFTAGYVLTGVFALGSGMTLLWPRPSTKESAR